jgi:hypothetical protein
MFGLSLLLSAARRTSRRGSTARRGLRQSRGETAAVAKDRDDLIDQRDSARAETASTLGNCSSNTNGQLDNVAPQRSLMHPLGNRTPPLQPDKASPKTADQPTRS